MIIVQDIPGELHSGIWEMSEWTSLKVSKNKKIILIWIILKNLSWKPNDWCTRYTKKCQNGALLVYLAHPSFGLKKGSPLKENPVKMPTFCSS